MKTKIQILLAVFLSTSGAMKLYGQGYVAFNNLDPSSALAYSSDTSSPLRLLDQDVNFQLNGGPPGSATNVIHTWLLSDGSATGINVAPGRFADPSHSVYAIPGTQPGGTAILTVLAWYGSFGSAASVCQITTGAPASAPGLTLYDPLQIFIPEPSVLALAIAGAVVLLARSRPHRIIH